MNHRLYQLGSEHVIVRSAKQAVFELAMQLIALGEWRYRPGSPLFDGYLVKNGELFLSAACREPQVTKFTPPYTLAQATEFAWQWYLANQQPTEEQIGDAELPSEGSVEVGFELSTERTRIDNAYQKMPQEDRLWGMVCSVKPVWLYYHK
ncbi:MAG: hypothetical protein MUC97_06400 [Bernardetiaceae bacterium]|jgi:hypothetical protein|nr:hypothetical protein [Bernardetiaceae bacterium]